MSLELMIEQARAGADSEKRIEQRLKSLRDAVESAFVNIGALCAENSVLPELEDEAWGNNQQFAHWLGDLWLDVLTTGKVPRVGLLRLATDLCEWGRDFDNFGLAAASFEDASHEARTQYTEQLSLTPGKKPGRPKSLTTPEIADKISTKRRKISTEPNSTQSGLRTTEKKRGKTTKYDVTITIQQNNPKREGTASYDRYERYKVAKTRLDFLELGGTAADYLHDKAKGFIIETGIPTTTRTTSSVKPPSTENAHPVVENGDHADPVVENGDHADPLVESVDHADPVEENGDHADPVVDNGDHADAVVENGDHADPAVDNGDHADPAVENGDHENAVTDGEKVNETYDPSPDVENHDDAPANAATSDNVADAA